MEVSVCPSREQTWGVGLVSRLADNLFEFAPRELSNSAMWAWILNGLRHPEPANARRQIATQLFEHLRIPVPRPTDVLDIQTEYVLDMVSRGNDTALTFSGKGNDRVDVLMRFNAPRPTFLFIENKVATGNNEVNPSDIARQIHRYDVHLHKISKCNAEIGSTVYPVYFGFEDFIAERVREETRVFDSALASKLRCCDTSIMLKAFSGTGYKQDPLLTQFYDWLVVKHNFVKLRRRAENRNTEPNTREIVDAADAAGFGHLLNAFLEEFRSCDHLKSQLRPRVQKRNINFRRGSETPLTVRWYYNSGVNGLFVGFSKSYKDSFDRNVHQKLPSDFLYHKESQWRFGFLRTLSEVSTFFGR
ncbi:hypothetical protein [Rhodovibrio sodomensis]|uniref:hypothetical protein n=1 Tax=Rhodovibrio sodomensis TaxID=1088 RepID=UPI001906A856|nr:hypothetical protein [Rhodovibrio sodomensis]